MEQHTNPPAGGVGNGGSNPPPKDAVVPPPTKPTEEKLATNLPSATSQAPQKSAFLSAATPSSSSATTTNNNNDDTLKPPTQPTFKPMGWPDGSSSVGPTPSAAPTTSSSNKLPFQSPGPAKQPKSPPRAVVPGSTAAFIAAAMGNSNNNNGGATSTSLSAESKELAPSISKPPPSITEFNPAPSVNDDKMAGSAGKDESSSGISTEPKKMDEDEVEKPTSVATKELASTSTVVMASSTNEEPKSSDMANNTMPPPPTSSTSTSKKSPPPPDVATKTSSEDVVMKDAASTKEDVVMKDVVSTTSQQKTEESANNKAEKMDTSNAVPSSSSDNNTQMNTSPPPRTVTNDSDKSKSLLEKKPSSEETKPKKDSPIKVPNIAPKTSSSGGGSGVFGSNTASSNNGGFDTLQKGELPTPAAAAAAAASNTGSTSTAAAAALSSGNNKVSSPPRGPSSSAPPKDVPFGIPSFLGKTTTTPEAPMSANGTPATGASAADAQAVADAQVLHPTGRELKVEDALLYLDQVKLEFGDRPRIYNEFLEIMKNFKAQEVDTIGVINRVRTLFHGYNNLILGFNTFLPDGYKIEMRDLEPVFIGPGLTGDNRTPGFEPPPGPPPNRSAAGRGGMTGRGQQGAFGRSGGRGMAPQLGRGRGGSMGRGGGLKPTPQQQQQMMAAQNAKQQQQQMQSQAAAQTPQQQQQGAAATRTIEFDHAIMYVTNIKKRFANQPRIYHTFLEILHTYQKEQRGIKEVLEQVSSLFADHPDLLREFTFFLPDAVQEQAKERLSRAAAEAEAKQRAAAIEAASKQQQAQAAADGKVKGAPTGWRTSAGGATPSKMGHQQQPVPSGIQKFVDMTQPDETGMESPRRQSTSGTQPAQEAFVYNAGVERQFFDLVKSALTSFSRDGQAYAEFIKTLDMYAQEILSRNDMLGYVERLLGKHKDLFEEFKRIINAVGSPDAPTHDDSWHSVPLSEIDFSRCRRCSPSYRALPRDYPSPPCSERSEMEEKVLNDVWVSLPLGSEENNTFRHMRKNQYEETLFRCEDMRFEIDMCIDSNATTLQRLTKIYDELQFLSENEYQSTKGSMVKRTTAPDGAGLGGKIYQYTLDGRVLGVIHKHSIKRIYGDDGNEMLQLCFKNPAVALPIVVNRLRQKDKEWRAAREVLNRKWKDLGEHNYYKSVDHRSLTWRTTDKRATSTRTIVADIKDRAAHDGMEGDSARNARIEKAKEEHGVFYEVTMANAIPRKMDLTGLPLPTKTIFTPHMSFMYDNNSWAQQDAYRIIVFALERGSINPGDKERCFRLWRDFLGPWLGLSSSWMSTPAASFTASPQLIEESDEDDKSTSSNNGEKGSNNDGEEESKSSSGAEDVANNDDDVPTKGTSRFLKEEIMKPSTSAADIGYFSSTNHIPFPPETLVSTTLGEGKVVKYNEDDGVYEVSYPSKPDTTYLKPDCLFGSLDPVEPSLLTEQLRSNDQELPERPDDQMIIGTQCLYLFFRLHQLLIRRLNIAKTLAHDVSTDTALGRHIEKLTFEGDPDEGKKRYDAFLGLVYGLVDAGTGASEPSEGGKFEDRVRYLLGNNAYELTTMDKLISHVLKHLQNMANNETMQNMIEIYRRHQLAGNFKPSAFREEAALMSEGENMYAFQICNIPKEDKKISYCEFLGCIAEDEDDEEDDEQESEDNKRGIGDVVMDEADDSAQATKRSRRA